MLRLSSLTADLTLAECENQISNGFTTGLTDTTKFASKLFLLPLIQLLERKEEDKTNSEV